MNLLLTITIWLWNLGIAEKLTKFKDFCVAYGAPGLFIISLLDSSFVPIPGGPDVILVTLAMHTDLTGLLEFVLAATLGSTLGCTILYLLARQGGERVLKRVSQERREYVEGLLGRYDIFAIMLASLMPPPFPFKPFILVSGVLKFKLPRLIIGLLVGRSLRFIILGILSLKYGEATLVLIKQYGVKILIFIVAILAVLCLARYLRTLRTRSQAGVVEERS